MSDVRLRVSLPAPKVRLRVLPSLLPTQIELRNTGTEIQWRYIDGVSDWMTLIPISGLLPLPADILAALLTVDGAGSGLDADLLDGLDSSAFDHVSKAVQVITASGTTAIAATTRVVILNLASPATVTLNLPTVASRGSADLDMFDFAGNATGSFVPDVADTGGIMGLTAANFASNAQGIGTGAAVKLIPNATILGWVGR